MQDLWKTIVALSNTPSRLDKERIIQEECSANNIELFNGFALALNPLITFGIKKIPLRKPSQLPDGAGLPWHMFSILANDLCDRTITGTAAAKAVYAYMGLATNDQWDNWYRRILLKSLRCGVTATTINKIVEGQYPEYAIPIFGCQLASDGTKHPKKLVGKKLLEPKLDGIRALTVLYPGDPPIQYSRSGAVLSNFTNIHRQLSAISNSITVPMVLDGEITSLKFQHLMTQVNRKYDINTEDANYLVFDMLPLKDFNNGICTTPQISRSSALKQWHDEVSTHLPNVSSAYPLLVDLDTHAGKAAYETFYQNTVAAGYEGIMVKNPDAPYRTKKGTAWLKRKPVIEVSLTIVGVEEGVDKYEGTMGAILCEGVDDDKFISTSVGGGFSDTDRDDFWNHRESVLGDIVEVRADAITQNKNGTYSLRFPRIRTFRGFSPGEKM